MQVLQNRHSFYIFIFSCLLFCKRIITPNSSGINAWQRYRFQRNKIPDRLGIGFFLDLVLPTVRTQFFPYFRFNDKLKPKEKLVESRGRGPYPRGPLTNTRNVLAANRPRVHYNNTLRALYSFVMIKMGSIIRIYIYIKCVYTQHSPPSI